MSARPITDGGGGSGGDGGDRFEHRELGGGVDLFTWPTQRFKTGVVRFNLIEPLDARAGGRALIASLLKRGCSRYPDMRSLSRRLEELYGAALGVDVSRLGERQHTQLTLGFVSERALRAGLGTSIGESPFRAGIDLLLDVLLEPVVVDSGFREEEFGQERKNLLRAIEGLRDDKAAYAHVRARAEMFRGEPYANHEYGEPERILALDRREVLTLHRERVGRAPIEVSAAGEFGADDVDWLAAALKKRWPARAASAPPAVMVRAPGAPRRIVERADVAQSRVWIGYRFDPRALPDRDYFALGVFDAVLGGGSLSKLFQEVREKRSLAYSVHSVLDRLKGALFLVAGVSLPKAEEAADVMRAQVGAIARGEVTAEELSAARASLLNSLRGTHDSADRAIQFAAVARALGRTPEVARFMHGVESVTREDVVRVAAMPKEELTFELLGADENGTDAGHESAG